MKNYVFIHPVTGKNYYVKGNGHTQISGNWCIEDGNSKLIAVFPITYAFLIETELPVKTE